MRCGYCQKGVPHEVLICPFCGFELSPTQPPGDRASASRSDVRRDAPGLLWYVALILLGSALLSATVALGLVGAEHGLDIRRRRASELGAEHYSRALIHLEQGNYLLALAEFEEAVRLAPDHEDARKHLLLLQALLGVEATGPSGAPPEVLLSLYGEASALHAKGEWPEAIRRLEELRSLDPSYRPQQVEEMLFDACYRQALALLEAGRLEESLAMLSNAVELDPDDAEAAELQASLSLYMQGLSKWDVDWEGAVNCLRGLHELNPTFLDAEERLHDALLRLGDLYYEEGAWCVAESRYEEALRVIRSEAAEAKRDQALDLCVQAIAEATPTEGASGEPTQPSTNTAAPVSTPHTASFEGEIVGRAGADATEMRIRVCVLDGEGRGVPGTGVELSAHDWRSDPRLTDADGCYCFAGLAQELEFEVKLADLLCVPLRVATKWGTETQVEFVERLTT